MCVVPPRFWLEVSYTPHPLHHRGSRFCCPMYRSLCGPQKRSGCFGKEQNMFLCRDSSHYSFIFFPLYVLFVISTELSQLQSWIYFERYDIRITIMSEIVFFHYVFWDVCIPCRLSETCRRFGGTCCLDFQNNFTVLQSFGKFLPSYSALQPIRQHPSSYRLLTQSV